MCLRLMHRAKRQALLLLLLHGICACIALKGKSEDAAVDSLLNLLDKYDWDGDRGFSKRAPVHPQHWQHGSRRELRFSSEGQQSMRSNRRSHAALPLARQLQKAQTNAVPLGHTKLPWDPSDMEDGDVLSKLSPYDDTISSETVRAPDNQLKKGEPLKFNWAMISCDRPGWARIVSSSLVSAFTNDMYPSSVSVIWCKPFNASAPISLFNNLRFASKVKVLYLPPSLSKIIESAHNHTHEVKNRLAFIRALALPKHLGKEDIPLLVTEDDVIFAPDFNAKLTWGVKRIQSYVGNAPGRPGWLLNMYEPTDPEPDNFLMTWYKRQWMDKSISFFSQDTAISSSLIYGHSAFEFGTQGILYSPAMARRISAHLEDVFYGSYEMPGFTDMIVQDFLRHRFNCGPKTYNGMYSSLLMDGEKMTENWDCVYFRLRPCLLQHVGTVSSVFQKDGASRGNQRFHLARTFPFKAYFPMEDSEETW